MSMNAALWKKAVSDAWLQLAVCSVLLVLFSWVFVWLMSLFPVGAFSTILRWMPSFVQPIVGVPLAELATPTGQLSILYVHAITLLLCVGWAVGRGSDPISGEIGRGTMDLILSLPIRRVEVLVAPAVVAAAGAAVLAASVSAGTLLGLKTVTLHGDVSLWKFFPGAVNLCAMTFCLTGVTALFSSFNRDRWRTISLAAGFFVISFIIKMVGRLWSAGWWLKYCTFLSAFQPQRLILVPDHSGLTALKCNLTLVLLGLTCYAAAGVIFSRRDIPAPL